MTIPAGKFYNADTGEDFIAVLESDSPTTFKMLTRLMYRDHKYTEPFIVPCDTDVFTTDLGSIPWYVAWTLPKFGAHLPAFLLHDALVLERGEEPTYYGPQVERIEADRIMRDAMGTLGSSRIRRWMAWAGVSLATHWKMNWIYKIIILTMLIGIVGIGACATAQLFGFISFIPWMMSTSLIVNLVQGAAAAILIPLSLSVIWGRKWKMGAIAGISLAFIMHITAAVFCVYAVYTLVEKITG